MAEPVEPPLEMLWETDAPSVVLADRFGFTDANAAAQWVAATVVDAWGIQVDSCNRIVMSDHNALAWVHSGSNSYIVKWSVDPKRFARLATLAKVTAWIGGEGIPVSVPVVAVDGSLQVEVGGVSVSLQRQIVGHLLDVSIEIQARAAGAELARLHGALADCPYVGELAPPEPEHRQLHARVVAWLESERSQSAPVSAAQELRRRVAARQSGPIQAQLVHGDYRSANVLVANERVAAILDFEEVRFDYPVVELAHAAVLLGTQFRNWAPVSSETHDWLLAGYQTVRPLREVELQWWDTLVLWFSLMFIPDGDDPTGWRAAAIELVSAQGDNAAL